MTVSTPARPIRPFSFRDRLGYMFGDFGNDFSFILQSTYFMIFYTNVVGIKPAHVGTLLLVSRILDAFTDVGMGMLVDRMPVRRPSDKFRRWVRWIAVPVAIASALMYMAFVADFSTYGAKLAWMCATYFLWGSIFYTAINIPYGSMASVISADPDERSQLSVWRSTGGTLANVLISSGLPYIIYVTNENGQSVLDGNRMMWSAVVCSVLAVGCYALLYGMVQERVAADDEHREQPSIGAMLAAIVTNRALLGLIAAALLLLLSMMFLSGMVGYLGLNWFNDGTIQSPANFLGLLPALSLIVLAPMIAKVIGKAETSIIAMLLGGAVLIAANILRIDNPWVWVGFYAVAMFCISVFNYLVWAFITDVIDYQEVRTGNRDDGTVYAIYSWARKLGQALAGFLTGAALGWVGYDATIAAEGGRQTQEAIDGIYTLTNLVPGVGCILVALAIWLLYPLKKKKVEENVRILAERHGSAQ